LLVGKGGRVVIRVSVEVSGRGTCFRAAVWAESVERAVDVARMHCPGGEVRVLFPINPDAFFVAKVGPAAGTMLPEVQEAAGRGTNRTVEAPYPDGESESVWRTGTL